MYLTGGSKGAPETTPSGSKFFHFHAVLEKKIENKIAFQYDAHRSLVDRIPAYTAQGGCLPRWVSAQGGSVCLGGVCLGRCLPRVVSANRIIDTCKKHNLCPNFVVGGNNRLAHPLWQLVPPPPAGKSWNPHCI